MRKPKNILIDLDTIKVGDILTFRKEHEREGIVNGDPLIVTKIKGKNGNCPVYVYSPDGKGDSKWVKNPDEGFGFYVWTYEYLDKSKACNRCIYSCKQNKDECSLLEEKVE